MTPELLPCPFCGGSDLMLGWVEGWRSVRCPSCHAMIEQETDDPKAAWNRRTPELTEALARLKALEERLRMGCGEEHQTVLAVREGFTGDIPFGCECSMADEIAAIRKAMGASDAAPTPEPNP